MKKLLARFRRKFLNFLGLFHHCIFCGEWPTFYHLDLFMCKRCAYKVAEGFESAKYRR